MIPVTDIERRAWLVQAMGAWTPLTDGQKALIRESLAGFKGTDYEALVFLTSPRIVPNDAPRFVERRFWASDELVNVLKQMVDDEGVSAWYKLNKAAESSPAAWDAQDSLRTLKGLNLDNALVKASLDSLRGALGMTDEQYAYLTTEPVEHYSETKEIAPIIDFVPTLDEIAELR